MQQYNAGSEQLVPKMVDEPQKKVEEEEKPKTFPVGMMRMCLERNMPRNYKWKESIMIKLSNAHQYLLIGNLVTPGLLVADAKTKKTHRKHA